MDTLTLDGEKYLSSKYAAKVTGYAKDYVGQLCREGRVDARLVGRNWYVREQSIRAHRFGQEGGATESASRSIGQTEKEAAVRSVRYTAEDATPLPRVADVLSETRNASVHAASVHTETAHHLPAMQQAWQEWFAKIKTSQPEEDKGDQQLPTAIADDSSRADATVAEVRDQEVASEAGEEVSVRRIRPAPPARPTQFVDIRPRVSEGHAPHARVVENALNEHEEEVAAELMELLPQRSIARALNIALMVAALIAFLIVAVNFVYKNSGNPFSFVTGTSVYTAK
ncbi:MAG: hypothetical protein B7X04_00655 [Parcubacteria group bacterium 21-54-25]|nr:MAG: hypothetical protein B7X04_00655 [Parcubacteria group bacterium 21-54-25]HQU07434.1 hypothetical protein [Candidatus Paceibacterota bacterium]